MLTIKCVKRPSQLPGAGYGIFVAEDVPRGAVVYKYARQDALIVSLDDLYKMRRKEPAKAKDLIHRGCIDVSGDPKLVVDADPRCAYLNETWNASMANWSFRFEGGNVGKTLRAIRKGEELLFCPWQSAALIHLDCAKNNPLLWSLLVNDEWRVLIVQYAMQRMHVRDDAYMRRYWSPLLLEVTPLQLLASDELAVAA